MVILLSTTIISCSQLMGLYVRLKNTPTLTPSQKEEIFNVILKVVPSCPVIIDKKNGFNR